MSSFEDINPYRWPGWAVTTLAGILGLLVLLFFRETRSFKQLKCTGGLCSGLVGLNLSAKLRSGSKIRILVSFMIMLATSPMLFLIRSHQCNEYYP